MWFMQMSFPKPHWVSSKPVHIWLRYGTPGGIFSQADFNEIRCQSFFALNTLKFWVSSKMVHIWPRYGTPGGEHKSKHIWKVFWFKNVICTNCELPAGVGVSFLAVQDGSISDIACHSVGLSESTNNQSLQSLQRQRFRFRLRAI